MELVSLPVSNLREIPAMLRKLADAIEAGEKGEVRFVVAVVVRRDDSQTEHGFGECSMHDVVGALAWGSSHLGDGNQ